MINFFRKIRKKLADDNMPLKYLRYAVGEIILVVIGILFALQINTWDKQQEDKAKEKEYLAQLTDELRSELQFLKNLRDDFEETEVSLKRIRRQWQSGNSTIKDSMQYLKDYSLMGFPSPWYTEPVTWTQLQQTGDLALIRDIALKNDLFVYYSELKKAADNYLQFPMEMVKQARKDMDMPFLNDQKTMDFINPLILQPSITFNSQEIAHHSEIFNQIWEYRMELLPLVVVLSNVSQAQQYLLAPIIDRGENLLINLENYQSQQNE